MLYVMELGRINVGFIRASPHSPPHLHRAASASCCLFHGDLKTIDYSSGYLYISVRY